MKNQKELIHYADDLKKKLLSVHKTVHQNIRMATDRMKTRYDLKNNSVRYKAVVTRINDVIHRI